MKQELKDLPAFSGNGFFYHGAYAGREDSVTHGFSGVAASEAAKYEQQLLGDGFSPYRESTLGGVRFLTMIKGALTLRLTYYPTLFMLKLVLTRGETPLPTQAEPYLAQAHTSITQLARKGAAVRAPGMCFVLQAKDGSFVIVDGGGENDEDDAALLRFLQENNKGNGLPHVRWWIITHPHSDHMMLAESFLERHRNDISLGGIAYNYPDFDVAVVKKENVERECLPHISRMEAAVAAGFPTAERRTLHAGDELLLAGLSIQTIATQEDYFPHEFTYVNHLSLALRICGENRTALLLGDCEKGVCEQMATAFEGALKCDILQTTHHGFNGAHLSLYRHADPQVCFWPLDHERFMTDPRVLGAEKGYEYNAFLRNPAIRPREHWTGDVQKTILL